MDKHQAKNADKQFAIWLVSRTDDQLRGVKERTEKKHAEAVTGGNLTCAAVFYFDLQQIKDEIAKREKC